MSAERNCARERAYAVLLTRLAARSALLAPPLRTPWEGERPSLTMIFGRSGRPRRLSFDFPEFHPNLTPQQMFALGIFGGSYWRPIRSGITGRVYRDAHLEFGGPDSGWWTGIPIEWLCSPYCRAGINHFGAYSGTSQQYWEERGWITAQDPYGWVQWYCRFYAGRRSPDDARQVARWMRFAGPRGRFLLQHQRLREAGRFSPAIAQALLQWGLLVPGR